MKEEDYIDVTNLTKLRIASNIIRDCFFTEDPNKTRKRSIIANLVLMIDDLEKKVDN